MGYQNSINLLYFTYLLNPYNLCLSLRSVLGALNWTPLDDSVPQTPCLSTIIPEVSYFSTYSNI